MSSQISWQCLSVQKFFRQFNWQGQLLNSDRWEQQSILEAEAAIANNSNSWKCLSVREFFHQFNWRAQPLSSPHYCQPDQHSPLTQQVREFFHFLPWEGSPEIGSLPQESSLPELAIVTSAAIETTITDLSELF